MSVRASFYGWQTIMTVTSVSTFINIFIVETKTWTKNYHRGHRGKLDRKLGLGEYATNQATKSLQALDLKEEEEEKPHPSHLCFRSCGPPWSSSVRKVHCYQLFRSFPEGLLDSPFARGINWLHSWLIRATKAKRTSLPSSFFSAEEGFDTTLRPSCVGRCQRMGNSLSLPTRTPSPQPYPTTPPKRFIYI